MSVTDRNEPQEAATNGDSLPDADAAKPTPPLALPERQGLPPMVIFWCGAMLLFLGAMAVYMAWKRSHEPVIGDSQAVPEGYHDPLLKRFTLTERSGREVRSEELLGKVWVANFFYSRCPGSCRLQTIKVAGLQQEFGKLGVQFVSITVDPNNDTPDKLREYARKFEAPPEWLFLTGEMLYLRRIGAEMFQLFVAEKEHVDRFAVVDKWGNVRGRFNWHRDLDMSRMRKLLPELVAERQEPEKIVDANPPPKRRKPIEYAEPPREVAPETLQKERT